METNPECPLCEGTGRITHEQAGLPEPPEDDWVAQQGVACFRCWFGLDEENAEAEAETETEQVSPDYTRPVTPARDCDRWRPVDGEEMPEDNTPVRVWIGKALFHGHERVAQYRSRNNELPWFFHGLAPANYPGVTHWRPAAKGPGGEDE